MIAGIKTTQDLFNFVARHLLKQNEQCLARVVGSDNACVYFGRNGLRCAIGCLIEPDHYYESLEFEGLADSVLLDVIRESIGRYLNSTEVYMLKSLQRLHDHYSPENWRKQLTQIAITYDLEMVA